MIYILIIQVNLHFNYQYFMVKWHVCTLLPISESSLAILSIFFIYLYLKEVMNVVIWLGITLVGLGTIGDVSF
ncbi:hypothetical protein Hdeb2414_s0002g00060991 [Helianthus debilis subsp. tardiflorus]